MNIKVTAYDKDKNVIKCDKCDKEAGHILMGETAEVRLCEDHGPYRNSQPATLVYRSPDGNTYEL